MAMAAAVPAAWPRCIMVRLNRQLAAAMWVKLAPRQATARLLYSFGNKQS
jgi:hypothetical protein